MKIMGLDIGSSSVGSAWVDTDSQEIHVGAGVFPAGVEERNDRRGDPKNVARRSSRSQRRSISRRADRKLELRRKLQEWGWMPKEPDGLKLWMGQNPWHLRRDGLAKAMSPEQFGRILLHMSQRRGPSWFDEDEEASEPAHSKSKPTNEHSTAPTKKRPLKAANEALVKVLDQGLTFGQFMADLFDQRQADGKPIRNRSDASGDPCYEFVPTRKELCDEFEKLWAAQSSFGGKLAGELTESRKQELYNPRGTDVWKCQGLLWGQRNTYWDPGTLGRCDLEPTDRVCTKADMYAQEFLVLQDVNNIRLIWEGESPCDLAVEQRLKVIAALENQKTATSKTVRAALGFNRKDVRNRVTLNIEFDAKKKLNTNWFVREIVGALGKDAWANLSAKTKDAINRAICKYDPREPEDVAKLTAGADKWWELSKEQAAGFIAAWKTRPGPDNRISLSRRAVQNLLPYLREGDSITEARSRFAEETDSRATPEQRKRYRLGGHAANHAVRHFLKKHPGQLPPAPMLANPVVRKAIHEVRKHVAAYLRKFGVKPDRVIVELAREARLSAKVANKIAMDNKRRRDQRDVIKEEFAEVLRGKSKRQIAQAVERVILCRVQKGACAYSNLGGQTVRDITPLEAAQGMGLEVDHVIPKSRGGSNGRGNKVLCYAATNRGKGNQTPKEWLSEEHFANMTLRFRHWKDGSREDRMRWNNLHKDVLDMEAYIKNQLTATAYASSQVIQWLEQVLYGEVPAGDEGNRHVFATNGRYTSILRRQWGLFHDEARPQAHEKSRADHRHHAIDAVVIACSGPKRIGQIAAAWQNQEYARGSGLQPEQLVIAPPWGNHESFRHQVLDRISKHVVSHRPERRKIVGQFHKETMYGPILDANDKLTSEFTHRIAAIDLKPNHLRIPPHWDTLREKLDRAETKAQKVALRRQMLNIEDVPAAGSGLVRDRWFREELRECLRENGLAPDNFDKKHIKALLQAGQLRLPGDRLVKKVTLRKVFNNTVQIPRRVPDMLTNSRRAIDPDPQSTRVYEAQSNHHIEIRETDDGRWVGRVVTTFEAATRVRPPGYSGRNRPPAVDRSDNDQGRFVMSLAIGEMVRMAHPDTGREGYFVVVMLDNRRLPRISLAPHWDAGKSKADENHRKREIIVKNPNTFRKLAVDGRPPEKVWVGPLGDIKPYRLD